jgi:predicted transcriptional regulator
MNEDDTADDVEESTETPAEDPATDVEGESVDVETESTAETEEETDEEAESRGARDRLEAGADRAVDELDSRVIDILSWVLDTETRGRIYVYLRQDPWSTSEEVAEGTGLYPSTVREALAELAEEEIVDRRKRESEGAGNNPYEYRSIAPSDLVGSVVGRVQEELNTIFTMDQRGSDEEEPAAEPVQIEVQDEPEESEE